VTSTRSPEPSSDSGCCALTGLCGPPEPHGEDQVATVEVKLERTTGSSGVSPAYDVSCRVKGLSLWITSKQSERRPSDYARISSLDEVGSASFSMNRELDPLKQHSP
jgi:hypothetical protein